jgi:hypothetical protein
LRNKEKEKGGDIVFFENERERDRETELYD